MRTERLVRLARAYRLADNDEGRLVRERSGISLRALAAAIGCNQGEVSRWERGLARPREEHALRWLLAIEALLGQLCSAELETPHVPATSSNAATPSVIAEGATRPIFPNQADTSVPLSRPLAEPCGADT
jgi:transcriptional regulator with XRE-family HTH domain